MDFKSLDSVHIYLMMLTLVLGQVLSDRIPDVSDVEHGLENVHALNLLPSWIRVLPLLQLSKYFGTLLMTICGMLKDALRFFMLVSVFSFGFSCALTPVLCVQGEEREQHGLLWAFWIIAGDDAGISGAQDRANQPEVALAEVRGPVPPLHARAGRQRAAFSLLIAVTNNTYEQNQTGQAGVPCPRGVLHHVHGHDPPEGRRLRVPRHGPRFWRLPELPVIVLVLVSLLTSRTRHGPGCRLRGAAHPRQTTATRRARVLLRRRLRRLCSSRCGVRRACTKCPGG